MANESNNQRSKSSNLNRREIFTKLIGAGFTTVMAARMATQGAVAQSTFDLDSGGPLSDPMIQLDFLRMVSRDPSETSAFIQNPAQYASNRGVILEPYVIHTITNSLLYGRKISDPNIDGLRVEQFWQESDEEWKEFMTNVDMSKIYADLNDMSVDLSVKYPRMLDQYYGMVDLHPWVIDSYPELQAYPQFIEESSRLVQLFPNLSREYEQMRNEAIETDFDFNRLIEKWVSDDIGFFPEHRQAFAEMGTMDLMKTNDLANQFQELAMGNPELVEEFPAVFEVYQNVIDPSLVDWRDWSELKNVSEVANLAAVTAAAAVVSAAAAAVLAVTALMRDQSFNAIGSASFDMLFME